jgi:hypothetical protein
MKYSYIYIAPVKYKKILKIGKADNAWDRLESLKYDFNFNRCIILKCKSDYVFKLEKILHNVFFTEGIQLKERKDGHTEFFKSSIYKDILDFIETPQIKRYIKEIKKLKDIEKPLLEKPILKKSKKDSYYYKFDLTEISNFIYNNVKDFALKDINFKVNKLQSRNVINLEKRIQYESNDLIEIQCEFIIKDEFIENKINLSLGAIHMDFIDVETKRETIREDIFEILKLLTMPGSIYFAFKEKKVVLSIPLYINYENSFNDFRNLYKLISKSLKKDYTENLDFKVDYSNYLLDKYNIDVEKINKEIEEINKTFI